MENTEYLTASEEPLIRDFSIEQLLSFQSRTDVAVSVVVPQGKKLTQVIKMVENDLEVLVQKAASEPFEMTKTQQTISVWKLALQLLQGYKKYPTLGLMCFVVLEPISTLIYTDAKVIATIFEPKEPIGRLLITIGKKLNVWPLFEFRDPKERFGILSIEKDNVSVGIIESGHFRTIAHMESNIPRKHGKGGSSAIRFARIRMEKRQVWGKMIANSCLSYFFDLEVPTINKLMIVGDKNRSFETTFLRSNSADPRLLQLQLGHLDLPETTTPSMEAARDLVFAELQLQNFELMKVKEDPRIQAFFSERLTASPQAILGVEGTMAYLAKGMVSEIVLTESKTISFQVEDGGKVLQGFVDSTLLHTIVTSAPSSNVSKLKQQSNLESYLKDLLKSTPDPPILTLVENRTPLSAHLATNHQGIGAHLKQGFSSSVPFESTTPAALDALGCKTFSDMI